MPSPQRQQIGVLETLSPLRLSPAMRQLLQKLAEIMARNPSPREFGEGMVAPKPPDWPDNGPHKRNLSRLKGGGRAKSVRRTFSRFKREDDHSA
jgi:hypothetical protein